MKGLSSLERVVLECIGNQSMTYEEVQSQSGLHENVCFNILQALIIRSILTTNGSLFKISENLSYRWGNLSNIILAICIDNLDFLLVMFRCSTIFILFITIIILLIFLILM